MHLTGTEKTKKTKNKLTLIITFLQHQEHYFFFKKQFIQSNIIDDKYLKCPYGFTVQQVLDQRTTCFLRRHLSQWMCVQDKVSQKQILSNMDQCLHIQRSLANWERFHVSIWGCRIGQKERPSRSHHIADGQP